MSTRYKAVAGYGRWGNQHGPKDMLRQQSCPAPLLRSESLLGGIVMAPMPLPERELIAQLRRFVSPAGRTQFAAGAKAAIRVGMGDDCAVLRIGSALDCLVTTDFSLEGIHFRRNWHPPESVGHRCLARGLSDIAAMGGEPVAAFLSLALPGTLPQVWVRAFFRGLLRLEEQHHVTDRSSGRYRGSRDSSQRTSHPALRRTPRRSHFRQWNLGRVGGRLHADGNPPKESR